MPATLRLSFSLCAERPRQGVFIVSSMRTVLRFGGTAVLLILGLALVRADGPADQFWPQWRGPRATGVSPSANPPTEWSETRNISWKVEIPGRGSASPIVWGDRL